MKKFSFLAALVLPLFIATAASDQPAVISAITGLTAPTKILFTANGNGLVSDYTSPGKVTGHSKWGFIHCWNCYHPYRRYHVNFA